MKKLALAILAIGITFTSFAQKQKIAHISSQLIIQDLAIKDSIPQKLQDFSKELEAEFMKQQQQLERDINEFIIKKDSLSPQIARMMEEQLGMRKQKLEQETYPQFQRMAQVEEQKLAVPLQEKLAAAIEKIAKADGYTYVLEEGTILYAGGTDITKKVRVELGLPEESSLPQAAAGMPIGQ